MSQAATHQEGEIALARLPSPPRGAWSMCESWIVEVTVVTHPLVDHKLTLLRNRHTEQPVFRRLVEELVTLLAYEATRGVRVVDHEIETPVAPTTGTKLASPAPLVVPILRAGLGMLDGMVKLLPTAEIGFLGMARDEETLQPYTYAERLPDDLSDRQCFVLDPMLATGGSAMDAITIVKRSRPRSIKFLCIIAAPEGLKALSEAHPDVHIYCAAVDEKLNEHAYIVPGLGDAGDRIFGTL